MMDYDIRSISDMVDKRAEERAEAKKLFNEEYPPDMEIDAGDNQIWGLWYLSISSMKEYVTIRIRYANEMYDHTKHFAILDSTLIRGIVSLLEKNK